MAEILNRLDFFQIGRRYVVSRAKRIEPTLVDVEGTDINLFVGSQSYCAHAVSRQLTERVSALLLDGGEGEDLDRYGQDRYQLPRNGAAAALGTVRFFRTSAALGGGTIQAGRKLITLVGTEFVTITDAVFGASDLSANAFVRAVQAGKEYQVGANQIRRVDRVGDLFDPTLQVNNDERTAGGEEVEDDDIYRERIRDFWGSVRRGTLQAIEFGARTVAGVESASAFEPIDEDDGEPVRIVELFIADSSGVASAALADTVQDALLEYRAGGIPVSVVGSIPQIIDIQLDLTFRAGVNTTGLVDRIRAAIVSFVNSLGVNSSLLKNDLGAVLARYRTDGLIPTEGSIVEPAGDLIPDSGRTLRTRLENVVTV